MSKIRNRGKIDDTLAAMFSNQTYSNSYLFYAHMIGQCSIKIVDDLGAAAGVAFNLDHYDMYIQPNDTWMPWDEIKDQVQDPSMLKPEDFRTENGVKMVRTVKGFDSYPLVQRLAILKHEMGHILLDHTSRGTELQHKLYNIAADTAWNQEIDPNHINEHWFTPSVMEKMLEKQTGQKINVPLNESAEFYYNLLIQNLPKQEGSGQCNGNCQHSDENGDSSGQCTCNQGEQQGMGSSANSPDNHDIWQDAKGDKDLKKDITKKMIEQSSNETLKSKGTVPNSFSDWLKLHSRKSEVNWKKILRGIVGNKKVGKRATIMRTDRRFPKREDLRGKTKDRMFNLLVVADVSGSMNDQAILLTLGEVSHICDMTKTELDLIQVDSQAYQPEKFSKKTKIVERKGCGGTRLYPAIEMAQKHGIDFQAVVVLTDGGLFGQDIENFKSLNKKVIWLIEPNGDILADMSSGKMQVARLKNSKNDK